MSGNINEIYSIEGLPFQTTESKRAIQKAKEAAINTKQSKLIYLNGIPTYKVDKRGVLAA